jgi:hypothetical protein
VWRQACRSATERRHHADLVELWRALGHPSHSVSHESVVGLNPTWATVLLDQVQFVETNIFLLFKLAQICKLPNQPFLRPKIL